ncbi:hypothetical protein RhiirA5_356507 [Rhizophagus irregularis]|uniref:Uncharacterized protein n=2 Tax=Rhizophagus irregularis TaxID=588596 RepID=A0A2I1E8V3_9GLOM|nr:hypothetical protein RirG_256540 [Rhizophagus irregularis DAOM 197198w]PKC09577.1 hypothetical protein RhiirA5_356507 [Rhizophagus irregularis]GET60029.1 hypothetical protein RIR_jg17376.t1 [Rhizophagus irregularis DAOM 181602=DAOM 197198]PKC65219.1 hypothetical protein RhiirA1_395449 [Rhizophagus irregularis]PKY18526.1 hypothetical protein RhiirB3_468612 [Rhizophagus irregularis]
MSDKEETPIINPGPISASGSTSPTTPPASSTPPTGSVSADLSSTGSALPVSHVSPEDSTSNGNPQDCGAEIDDAVVSLIAQNLYNSSFQCDYPSYYDPEMGLANIFKGDSSFGTINSLNDLKSQVEEYLEILNLG